MTSLPDKSVAHILDYSIFFKESNSLLSITDNRGVFLDVSRGFAHVLKMKREDVVGKPFMEFVHPDDIQRTIAKFNEINRDQPQTIEFENRYIDACGDSHDLQWTSYLDIEKGLVFSSLSEVTDLRAAEAASREMYLKLEQSNLELSQFAFIATYEIKQPLKIINGYARILKSRYKRKLNEQGIHLIQNIESATVEMDALLDYLTAYSKANHKRLPYVEFNLAKDFSRISEMFDFELLEKGIVFTVKNLPERIVGNRIQLLQVFQNCIENSIKYQHPDRQLELIVTCKVLNDNNGFEFSITDNGIGISPDVITDVFELFKQGNPLVEGSGVGLSLCRKIVNMHGGKISVDSVEGQSTTIRFTIPKHAVTS